MEITFNEPPRREQLIPELNKKSPDARRKDSFSGTGNGKSETKDCSLKETNSESNPKQYYFMKLEESPKPDHPRYSVSKSESQLSSTSSDASTKLTNDSSGFGSVGKRDKSLKNSDKSSRIKSPMFAEKPVLKPVQLVYETRVDSFVESKFHHTHVQSLRDSRRANGNKKATSPSDAENALDANLKRPGSKGDSKKMSRKPRSFDGVVQNTAASYQTPEDKPRTGDVSRRRHRSQDVRLTDVQTQVTRLEKNNFRGSPRSRKENREQSPLTRRVSILVSKAPYHQGSDNYATTFVSNRMDGHRRNSHHSHRSHKWFFPEEVIRRYGSSLSEFERSEILYYKKIYYFGLGANKSSGRIDCQYNHGFDNKKGEYKTLQHDHIAYRYEVLGTIGKGAFGEVVAAYDHKKQRKVALKIIRNRPNLHEQARVEVKVLKALERRDPKNKNFTLRIFDDFTFRNHPCIVCELIGDNLYEVLKQNDFHGLPVKVIRSITKCVLKCLFILSEESIIHCDIKPENILLVPGDKPHVKLIDFGSSCRESEQIYNYIQSRYYRAPEVIFGMHYTTQIDMWSLGCVLAELYTGVPIFPGANEADQVQHISRLLGDPPGDMIKKSTTYHKLMNESRSQSKTTSNTSRSFDDGIASSEPLFEDFVLKCLKWKPEDRMTVEKALKHPWIKHEKSPHHSSDNAHRSPQRSCTVCGESPITIADVNVMESSYKRIERRDSGVSFEWLQPIDTKIKSSRYDKTMT